MRTVWLAVFAVACGGAASPKAAAPATTTSAARLPEPPPAHPFADLAAQLARQPVHGIALASGAMFSPTQAVATEKPAYGRRGYVTVLEDLGSVVRVRTSTADASLKTVDPSWEIDAFLPKQMLAPVLRAPVTKSFDDGTGFVLREGLQLSVDGAQIRPVDVALEKLPLTIQPGDVVLGFDVAPNPPRLPDAPGVALACEDSRTGVRVGTPAELRPPPGAADDDRDRPSCTLNRSDARLHVGKAVVSKAGDVAIDRCFASVDVRSAGERHVLVTYELQRAVVRARTVRTALEDSGRCGAMAAGARMVWAVEGDAPVFFADGSRAGRHVGKQTKLRFAREQGARLCVHLPWLTTDICLEKKDLRQVEDHGF